MTVLEIRRHFAQHAMSFKQVKIFIENLSDEDWEAFAKATWPDPCNREDFLEHWSKMMGI